MHKPHRPFLLLIALLLLTTLTVAGCGGASSAKGAGGETEAGQTEAQRDQTPAPSADEAVRTIRHELGETEIKGIPSRVVVLEYSFVDALASVGVSPVGIADDGKKESVIPQVRSLIDDWTSVGTRKQPNLEIIASLQPDLIVADLKRHKEIYDQLSQIAPTIVLSSLQATYEENLASLAVIGEALGKVEEMERRLEEHRTRMQELAARVPEGEQRKVLSAVVTDKLFNAHTSSAYTPGVLEAVGLPSAIQTEAPYARLNLEQLVEIDPDVIFVMASDGPVMTDQWADNPLWQNLKAVRSGAVYRVDRVLWSKARGVIAAEAIAEEAVTHLYGK